MNQTARLAMLLVGCLLTGCGTRTGARPRPGDTLTPQIVLTGPWKPGTSTIVYVRLQVEGAGETRRLRVGELQGDALPRLSITFLRGDETLGPPRELATVQDC